MLFTPGFFQSFELLLQCTTVYPSDSAILRVALLNSPLGGRNSLTCFTPSFVKHLVLVKGLVLFHLSLEMCVPILPISCPSFMIRSTISGCLSAHAAERKKVAFLISFFKCI